NITGCDVVCLTGDATVQGNNDQTGQSLTGGTSTSINNGGNAADADTLTEEEKSKLAQAAVQQWLVNTALNMNNNKEAKIQMVVEVPDNTANPEQSALDVVLKALQDSGITLNEEVRKELEGKLTEEMEKALENATPLSDSDPGESSVSYINYAAAGTYGPESAADVKTISKNVIISAPGITLRNMIITRDLTLGAGIGDGDVTLENVKVQGNTKVLGGGSQSVTLLDCELYTVTVDKDEVRIVAKGTSAIGALTLNTAATLTESDLTGAGFSSVSTGLTLPAGAKIILSGNFEAVNINAPDLTIQVDGGSIKKMNIAATASGTDLTLAAGTSVADLEINAQANIGGTGTITAATITVNNVVMAQIPTTLNIASGITSSIGGEMVNGGTTQILSSIVISGDESINVSSGGTSRTYTATVKDQAGNSMTGESVTWSLMNQEDRVSIGATTGILTVESGSNAASCIIIATSISKPAVKAQLEISLSSGSIGQMNVNSSTQVITGTCSGSGVTGGGVYIKNKTLNKWVKPRGDYSTGQAIGFRYADNKESCFIGPFTGSNGSYGEWSLDLSNLNLTGDCEYTAYLRVDDANGVHQDQDAETFSLGADSIASGYTMSIIEAQDNGNGTCTIIVDIKDGSDNCVKDLNPEDFSIWLDGAANPICLAQAPLTGFCLDGNYLISLFGEHILNKLQVKGVSIPMPEDPQTPGTLLPSLELAATGGQSISGRAFYYDNNENEIELAAAEVQAYVTDAYGVYVISRATTDANGEFTLLQPNDCGSEVNIRCIKQGYAFSCFLDGNNIMVSDTTSPNNIGIDNPNIIAAGECIILSTLDERLSPESWIDIYEWIKSHTSSDANPWSWITGIPASGLLCYINPDGAIEIDNNSETQDAQIVKDFIVPNYLVVDAAGNVAQENITIDSLCYWKDDTGLGTAGSGSIALASSSVAYVDSEHQPHIKTSVDPGEWIEETENWPDPGNLPSCQDIDLFAAGTNNYYKMFCAYREDTDKLSFMQYAYDYDNDEWGWTSPGSPAPNEEVSLFKTSAVNMEGMYFPAVAYQHTVGDAVYGSISSGTINQSQFEWHTGQDFYSGNALLKALAMNSGLVAYVDNGNNLFVKQNQGDVWNILCDSLPLDGGFKISRGLSLAFNRFENPVIAYADNNNGIHVLQFNGGNWSDISPTGLTAGNSPLQLLSIKGSGSVAASLMLAYTSGNENRISVRFYCNISTDEGVWSGENGDPRVNDISPPVASGTGALAVEKGQVTGNPSILFKGEDGRLHLITPVFPLGQLLPPIC
ncbi:MAG: hypothetical protein ABFD18_00910, partial [Syntrophomonas sp.]